MLQRESPTAPTFLLINFCLNVLGSNPASKSYIYIFQDFHCNRMAHKKRSGSKNVERKSALSTRPNLWVIISVVILIAALSVITALGPFNLTGNTVQAIGYMNKGDALHLGVRDVPALEALYTNAAETIKSGKIEVVADDSISFNRPYVSKFKVSSEGKFGPIQFNFRVKEQDLLAKGISRGDLRLYQGAQGYDLQILKVDNGYLYYIVTVPSMGSFVLGRVDVVANETVTEKAVTEKATEEPEAPVVKEPESEAATAPEKEALAGKAVEVPAQEKQSLWARIVQFFRNLFS